MKKFRGNKKSRFLDAVYRVVATIPRGKTMTYAEVARRAGFPKAARAVGTAMKKNPDPRNIPCHRVVRADGMVGDYVFGGTRAKIERLQQEGVKLSAAGRVLAKG